MKKRPSLVRNQVMSRAREALRFLDSAQDHEMPLVLIAAMLLLSSGAHVESFGNNHDIKSLRMTFS